MLARPHVLRALEHHVLEQVGEARAALPLVSGPDLIADGDGIDRRVVILRDDHAQTIVQGRIRELQRRDLGGRLLGVHQARGRDQNRK